MKIEKLDESLISFVIGIRFRANFSIEDQLGKIVDKILYSKGAFFNSNFFPKVYSSGNEKVLLNEEEDKTLRINNSNVILEIGDCENYKSEQIEEILLIPEQVEPPFRRKPNPDSGASRTP